MLCRVCEAPTTFFDEAPILTHHVARYNRCCSCGSIQIEDPSWLNEAYASAIAESDIGLPSRAVYASAQVSALIRLLGIGRGQFLDYSAGNGLFVRLMRDRGFDFRWNDVYAENQFAKGFEGDLTDSYALITAFEVVEHLPNPFDVLRELSSRADVLVLSTFLVADPPPRPGSWWYYALETGQHITFLSKRGLECIAGRLGMCLRSRGSTHILSHRAIRAFPAQIVLRPRVAAVVSEFTRQPTLLTDDYRQASAMGDVDRHTRE